jgi:glycosyltransferase involved in cell wall biosynthesis
MDASIISLVGHLGKGGTERQLFLLTRYLAAHQFRCGIIVFNESPHHVYDNALKAAGVNVWHVPPDCQGIPARMRWLYRKLREQRPAIVHSWTVHDNPYAGIVGRLAGVPICWGSLRSSIFNPGFKNLSAFYRFLSFYSVSRVIVNSDKTRRELRQHYKLAPERITHLPNCVYTEPDTPVAADFKAWGIAPEQPVIGFVGNLREVKNPSMFIEGMAQIITEYPDTRAILIGQPIPGQPELQSRLETQINHWGLNGKVILAGFRHNVMAFMRRFTLLAITSRSEGLPNVLLEAMAVGCPVVATRVGGIPEIVENGRNGLLVETGNVAQFVAAVEQLLTDKELAHQIGAAGQRLIQKKYHPDLVGKQLLNMYTTALANLSP